MQKVSFILVMCIISLISIIIIYYLIKNNYENADNITINNNQYKIGSII